MSSFRLSISVGALIVLGSVSAVAQTHHGSLDRLDPSALIGFGSATAVAGDEIFVGRPGEFSAFPMPGSEAARSKNPAFRTHDTMR